MIMKKTTDKQPLESKELETNAERLDDSKLSRRRFTRAGLAAPIILSMASKPAFGAVCSPSGFVSYSPDNPSGVRRHGTDGCGGLSPGAWRNPDAGRGDGSRGAWHYAGYYPNPRQNGELGGDPPGTLFVDVFGVHPEFGTLHDVLLEKPGSLEFHVVAALLNSRTIPGYMSHDDVIGLYLATINGHASYTTTGGVTIQMHDFYLKEFIEQTYH